MIRRRSQQTLRFIDDLVFFVGDDDWHLSCQHTRTATIPNPPPTSGGYFWDWPAYKTGYFDWVVKGTGGPMDFYLREYPDGRILPSSQDWATKCATKNEAVDLAERWLALDAPGLLTLSPPNLAPPSPNIAQMTSTENLLHRASKATNTQWHHGGDLDELKGLMPPEIVQAIQELQALEVEMTSRAEDIFQRAGLSDWRFRGVVTSLRP